jgi:hypothetical protein
MDLQRARCAHLWLAGQGAVWSRSVYNMRHAITDPAGLLALIDAIRHLHGCEATWVVASTHSESEPARGETVTLPPVARVTGRDLGRCPVNGAKGTGVAGRGGIGLGVWMRRSVYLVAVAAAQRGRQCHAAPYGSRHPCRGPRIVDELRPAQPVWRRHRHPCTGEALRARHAAERAALFVRANVPSAGRASKKAGGHPSSMKRGASAGQRGRGVIAVAGPRPMWSGSPRVARPASTSARGAAGAPADQGAA